MKTRDVALVTVLICIISFAKGGKFSYEATKVYKMTPVNKSKVSSFHRKKKNSLR